MSEDQSAVQGTRELKRVAVLANAVTCVLAFLAIVACGLLYVKVNHDNSVRECVRRIDLYVQDLRDDVNLTGWDALVAQAQRSGNQDPAVIAAQMRKDIDRIKNTRQLRRDANTLCDNDYGFKVE